MIVNYDKEIDMVYISKKVGNRWVQVGFTKDEVKQIVSVKAAAGFKAPHAVFPVLG